MSRIGKLPVNVPKNVNVELTGQEIKVKGPHGELLHTIPSEIEVSVNEDQIVVNKKNRNTHCSTKIWFNSSTNK